MRARLKLALIPLLCALAAGAPAQTLAHKNWAGSGITVEPWYQSALFYQIDPLTFQDANGDGFGDLAGIATRLPYLQQLGVDAIVLSPLPLNPPGGLQPFDSTYGTPDDFDRLELEANAHHMRLFVDLPVDLPHEQLIATARFWLSRGVAGLRLTGSAPDRAQLIRELRAITGPTRILLSDTAGQPAVASRHPAPRAVTELAFDRRLTAAQTLTPALLRSALTGTNLLSDLPSLARSLTRLGDGPDNFALARITAAALLLGRGAPLLYFGQELGTAGTGDPTPMQWGGAQAFTTATPWIPMGPNAATANVAAEDPDPDSLLNWYRRLAQLHHAEPASTLELLPTPNPSLVAWLRKPRAAASPALLVLVNLSPYATVTPLSSLLPTRTATLAMVAKSSPDAEPANATNAIALEGYGVYIAELRNGPGLESVVLPARRHR